MGARFEIAHANLVGYLTADAPMAPPRSDLRTISEFLEFLADGRALISATQGTDEDWVKQVARTAKRQLAIARNQLGRGESICEPPEVARLLKPLKPCFSGYDFYAMVFGAGGRSDLDSYRLFTEAAVSSHSAGLVLFPEGRGRLELTQFVDPFPALRAMADNPIPSPAVVFWTALGSTCVLPLDRARQFFRNKLLPAIDRGPVHIDRTIAANTSRQRVKRILHLSDLHFGQGATLRRRGWLKEHLNSILASIDRVVVTGDLLDNPREELREAFDEFRLDVERMTGNDLLVIPGNHDVRERGNAFGPLGRNAEFVVDLRWDPLTVDEELRTVFFSFNSNEAKNFAMGSVSDRQRRNRATLYNREKAKRPELEEYLKVALVHHHPYAYPGKPRALYERIVSILFDDTDRLIAFEGSTEFLRWCAIKGVSLILHGHKHVPHLVEAYVPLSTARRHPMTVVGCGSSTGAGGRPMCYDIVTMDPETRRWSVSFFHDEKGDGAGFALQNVAIDLRP